MPRLRHGTVISLQPTTAAREAVSGEEAFNKIDTSFDFVAFPEAAPDLQRFDYLFPQLQTDSANLLHKSTETVAALKSLGETMHDPTNTAATDSGIPAIYTYFGQFIDHDITLEVVSDDLADITDPYLEPLSLKEIRGQLKNGRSPSLDLDSVYGYPAPCSGEEMVINRVSFLLKPRPPGKDDFNDLPRRPRSNLVNQDREALIGDSRNDENLILAQLHVAFLRAHNAIVKMLQNVDKGPAFEKARTILRQHYQWIVIHDFLKKVADPVIVDSVLVTNRWFNPCKGFFMPLEFTVAAYRFGHSMVRARYDFNVNFQRAPLEQLFTFTALSGNLGRGKGSTTLPEEWIIEWQHFVKTGRSQNAARRIDTMLVEPLFKLFDETGQILPGEARLAVRNLLRGYLLRMPTGQAVARALHLPVLTPAEIEEVAANDKQLIVLREAGFLARTPLWFYILAEAAHERKVNGTDHLGQVGSTLVAEVLIGLVRRSPDSILSAGNWAPTLGETPGKFDLPDLLRLAGVLC